MGIFNTIKEKYFSKKKYNPTSLEELKGLVNNLDIKLSDIDTSKVDSFEELFKGVKRTDFSGIEEWNTSNVTNMRNCFKNCKTFNSDISKWNTSNVTAMSGMFAGATIFDQNISSWDLSAQKGHYKASFVSNMFKGANAMIQRIKNVESECSEKGIAYDEEFALMPIPRPRDYDKRMIYPYDDLKACEVVKNVEDLAKVDTSAMKKADHLFENDERKEIKNVETLDLQNVIHANDVFKNAKYFNQPYPTMDNVVFADGMFNGASSYNQPIPTMPKVASMEGFLSNNEVFDNEIAKPLKNAPIAFADNSFDKVKKEVKERELNKLSDDHGLNIQESRLIAHLLYEKSNEPRFSKSDVKEIDPNNQFIVIVLDEKAQKQINENYNNLLGTPIRYDNLNKAQALNTNALGANTFIISKKAYESISKDESLKFDHPYLNDEKKYSLGDVSCKFTLDDFVENLSYTKSRTGIKDDYWMKHGIIRGNDKDAPDLSIKNHFPMLKTIESMSNGEDNPHLNEQDLLVKKLNELARQPQGRDAFELMGYLKGDSDKSKDPSLNNFGSRNFAFNDKERFYLSCKRLLPEWQHVQLDECADFLYEIKNTFHDYIQSTESLFHNSSFHNSSEVVASHFSGNDRIFDVESRLAVNVWASLNNVDTEPCDRKNIFVSEKEKRLRETLDSPKHDLKTEKAQTSLKRYSL